MKLLAIETSTNQASVALLADDKVFFKENSEVKQHAEFLLPMISELLNTAGIHLDELQGIVFGCGPGSFTGIRVASSICKGLGYGLNLPLYPVSSLQAMAMEACSGDLQDFAVLSVLDARIGEVYWGYFPDLTSFTPFVTKVDAIAIPKFKKIILAGSCYLYRESYPRYVQDLIAVEKNIYPSALSMLKLVQNGYVKPVTALDAAPLYVRNKVI